MLETVAIHGMFTILRMLSNSSKEFWRYSKNEAAFADRDCSFGNVAC
jgi:hypothetical protein